MLIKALAAAAGNVGAVSGYLIDNSLRFNDDDSAYLSRTPSVAGDRKTWTWSGWFKRGNVGTSIGFFGHYPSGVNNHALYLASDDTFVHKLEISATNYIVTFAPVFRDTSGWYHIVFVYDTTQGTSSDRVKLYVNGELQPVASATYPSQNLNGYLNSNVYHEVGGLGDATNYAFDGYMSEINFIDGQALTADDFGEINEDTGEWSPKKYSGTYGTNGFYLQFKDGAALGDDTSGNTNDWTPTNLASTDQMLDTPTNNFAVLNPLDPLTTGTLSDGNLVTSGNAKVSLRPTSGQWYYEKDGVGFSYDADTSGQFNPTLAAGSYNFGQYPWADTGPAGTEKALCTDNLPEPAIVDSESHFNVVTYTGTGTTLNVTGVGFQPDLVWMKRRDSANTHDLIDVVRGDTARLFPNLTDAELSDVTFSFDSDGFSPDPTKANENAAGGSYVAWCWKAGGTAVTNTDGSITSQVSANVDAGFSIVGYTGSGAVGSVGVGLTNPELIIIKDRDASTDWYVHTNAIDGSEDYLILNSTASALSAPSGYSLGSNVFNFGGAGSITNLNGRDYIAYCFHSVEGFSKFGSYVGNGSTNGTFVYTGFRPAFVMIKATSRTGSWEIVDNERSGYNGKNDVLYANLSDAEYSGATYPFELLLSNGFKLTSDQLNINESGQTYIYMAFAEAPFKNAVAR